MEQPGAACPRHGNGMARAVDIDGAIDIVGRIERRYRRRMDDFNPGAGERTESIEPSGQIQVPDVPGDQ